MPIDYNEEANQIQSFSGGGVLPWWNPTVGSHRIKILSEGEEYSTVYKNQTIPKVRFEIEVNGEKYNWGVNKGKTTRSLWGQLVMLGKAWGGLKDKTISLVVKTTQRRDGTTIREFTVLEAVNLQAQQASQQPSQSLTLRQRVSQLRGQSMTKNQWISTLGIDEQKFNSLVEIGLLEPRGNRFVAV